MKNRLMMCLLAACSIALQGSGERSIKHTNMWRRLNQAGRIGSAMSFGYWLPSTMTQITTRGLWGAVDSTHIPRLAIDAICVASSHYKDSDALNWATLVGSTASLMFWAPAAIACPEPIILSRVALDTLQMGLALHRLLKLSELDQKRNIPSLCITIQKP
jgi:hypothetical protein